MPNCILILTAMEEELEPLKHLGERVNIFTKAVGIGKVNAVYNTYKYIQQYNPNLVIMTGMAGSLNPTLKIGDITLVTQAIQGDLDITAFGHPLGYNSTTPDKYILQISSEEVLTSLKLTHFNLKVGGIITTDKFLQREDKELLMNRIKSSDSYIVSDMETYSTMFVCDSLNIPCIVLRTVSDTLEGNATEEFRNNLKEASEKVVKIIEKICKDKKLL